MKKVVMVFALLLSLYNLGAQEIKRQYRDTVSFPRDTILKYSTQKGYVNGTWYIAVDSLDSVYGGMVELMVANDPDSTVERVLPDSLFVRYEAASIDTLDQVKRLYFKIDKPLYCDYIGLKISADSVDSWYFRSKLMLFINR